MPNEQRQDLNELIRSRGYDQKTFAEDCEISQTAISNYTLGKLTNGSKKTFQTFANVLGVTFGKVWDAYNETQRRKAAETTTTPTEPVSTK